MFSACKFLLTGRWFTFRAGGLSWKGMLVMMGGVCGGGMSQAPIPVLSGCSQVRRAGPGPRGRRRSDGG